MTATLDDVTKKRKREPTAEEPPAGGTGGSGEVGIEVPRDRAGEFEPQIVRKRQRRLGGVDEMVLSLYAKGLTTGEISAHFAEIYGASVSKETISRITDKVIEEMQAWQARPLDEATRRSSSTRSWSRCAMGRSPTGPSTPRSASPWPGRKTSSACGPAPAGRVVGLPQVRWGLFLLLPEVMRYWCDLWRSWWAIDLPDAALR